MTVTDACGGVADDDVVLTLAITCSLPDIVGTFSTSAGGTPGGPRVCGDSIVDGSEFIAFINSFNTGDPTIDPLADVAGGGADALLPDGTINGDDFIAFINAFSVAS